MYDVEKQHYNEVPHDFFIAVVSQKPQKCWYLEL